MIMAATTAFAHEGGELTDQTASTAWNLTPDIIIPTALVALIYVAGLIRRRAVAESRPVWRHLAFFGGLGAVFLSLQSPIDPIAERLFWMHQIQHLLIRMVGPMLIALSWPQGTLAAGLRILVGSNPLKPIVSNRIVGRVFRILAQPVVATILFIAALYAWEVPAYHNLAIVNEAVHYGMHITMLLAGLLFWWLVFDRRPSPQGLRYGTRLMMLWLSTLSNIVLGAYTVLKSTVLYGAYDIDGRLFGFSALADEQIGGFIIWIPSSMMCLIGVLIVIHMWGRQETAAVERADKTMKPGEPGSGAALIAQQRPRNQALAVGFAAFAIAIFAVAILVGILDNLSGDHQANSPAVHALHGEAAPTL